MNAADHVSRHARETPDRLALSFEGRIFTYGDLDLTAARVAAGLRSLGVRTGDRVAIVLPNVPEFVIAYLAILRLGAIAVSLNGALKQRALGHMLNDCAPCVVFATPETEANIPWTELGEVPTAIGVEGTWYEAVSFEQLAQTAYDGRAVEDMTLDAPASILYSSGTTGFPKGVTLSHRNLIFNSEAKIRYCGIAPEDRLLLFLPLFHSFGQNAVLNAGLHAGATVILHRCFHPNTIIESIQQEQITMFFGVPTVYTLLLDRTPLQDLASVRYWFSAAAPMPTIIARRWQNQTGLLIYEAYGLTETSPFACYNHEIKYKPGSVGTPISGVEIGVIDPYNKSWLSSGKLGEIVIRGPNVMLGYWHRPEDTREAIFDGWFRTGDLGRIDNEGYVFIVDRIKDMIDVAGMKVWPVEVENMLIEHPDIYEAAVFGRPDAVTGEKVVAHVVLRAGSSISQAELQAWCREQIARDQVPVEIKMVEQLPKNAAGKVLRRLLREGSGNGQ